MSAAWQRAHVQLLEEHAFPVRTHEWWPPALSSNPAATREGTKRRRELIRRWLLEDPKSRLSEREFAARLDVSRVTVQNHIRWLRANEG